MENAKILIVEDNAIVAEGLKDSLLKLGYSVTGIENNKNGAIKNTETKKPDLVLMDIMLYGEISGIEIADYIRSKFNVPVIFLTALSDKTTLQKAKRTQPYGYIIKPVDEHSLESTIQIALYKHTIAKKLIESEEQFRQLSENIQLGFWLINIKKPVQVLYVNPAFEKMWGIKAKRLYTNFSHFYKSLHNEDANKLINVFDNFITSNGETNCEIEHRIIDKNGEVRWIWTRLFGIKNYKGKFYRAAGLAQDITEQKLQSLRLEELVNIRTTELTQSNEKLKTENVEREKAEQKFKELIELAPDPIITLDVNGKITSINHAALTITNLPGGNKVVGKHYSDFNLIPGKDLDLLKSSVNAAVDGKTNPPIEFNFTPNRSNEVRYGEARFSIIKSGGESKDILVIIRDVTERKKIKEQLENRENELMTQNVLLEEKNIALRELLQQIETAKNRIATNLQTNVNRLILPLIEKLIDSSSEIQNTQLDLLKNNLLNLLSPFGHEISKNLLGLTQKEIEICNMIKSGQTSKDIARLMNVSYRTVETHRNNIRKKLNILNENINLQTYLRSIDEPSNS
jgi:PAS domain S-box-containing protein